MDVPAEFDVTSSLKEDFVDHQIVASKVECIELLRLKPLVSNKHSSSFKASFFTIQKKRNSSHLHHVNKIYVIPRINKSIVHFNEALYFVEVVIEVVHRPMHKHQMKLIVLYHLIVVVISSRKKTFMIMI